jgi:hypothetical protein
MTPDHACNITNRINLPLLGRDDPDMHRQH